MVRWTESWTTSSRLSSFRLKTKRAFLASSMYSVRCPHTSRSDCSTIALLLSFRALLLSLAFSFEIMINAGTKGGNRRITIREMTSIGLFGLRVKFFQWAAFNITSGLLMAIEIADEYRGMIMDSTPYISSF